MTISIDLYYITCTICIHLNLNLNIYINYNRSPYLVYTYIAHYLARSNIPSHRHMYRYLKVDLPNKHSHTHNTLCINTHTHSTLHINILHTHTYTCIKNHTYTHIQHITHKYTHTCIKNHTHTHTHIHSPTSHWHNCTCPICNMQISPSK